MRRQHLASVPCITALFLASAHAAPGGDARAFLALESRQDLERPLVLVTDEDVVGAPVENRGEALGTLRDLVVDRLTGRAVYGIVAAEGSFGLGDVDVAIPYAELGWHTGQHGFVSDLDAERLAKMQVFSPEGLQDLAQATDDQSRPVEASAPVGSDVLASFFEVRMPERIAGEVVSVATWSHASIEDGHGEYVALTIEATGGSPIRVLLGPSSFLEEKGFGEIVPGVRVEADGVRGDDGEGELFVATELGIGEAQLTLRDDVGVPAWPVLRYVLASELTAATVYAGDEGLGRPTAVVLDARTGQVVFLALDLEGETCPLPMRAVTIAGEGRLLIHGRNAEDLHAAPRLLGNEISELNDPTLRAAVYEFFGIDAGRVLPRRS